MSTGESISVSVGKESRGFLASAAAVLSLSVLLLGGTLHATPITSVGDSQLPSSKQVPSRGTTPVRMKQAAATAVAGMELSSTPSEETSAQSAAGVCILSSDCATTVQVPEPQSLVLVGSGLLSMAGLIRRRMLR